MSINRFPVASSTLPTATSRYLSNIPSRLTTTTAHPSNTEPMQRLPSSCAENHAVSESKPTDRPSFGRHLDPPFRPRQLTTSHEPREIARLPRPLHHGRRPDSNHLRLSSVQCYMVTITSSRVLQHEIRQANEFKPPLPPMILALDEKWFCLG